MSGRRLSVVAGAGALVPHVVAAALRAGDKVQVLALTPRDPLPGARLVAADIRNPLGLVWSLKTFRTSHVVLAGAITLSDKAREDLARFAGAEGGSRGDAALSGLGAAVRKLTGAELLGVHEIAADLLAGEGHLAGPAPSEALLAACRFALRTAREVGRLDLGQAVVTTGSRTVAAEDVAGTDELLARIGRHRAAGLVGDGAELLVLGKASKPGQPLHIDLPAIGAATIAGASAVGVGAIAVEAGRTLLIERAALVAAADAAGITLVGLVADG